MSKSVIISFIATIAMIAVLQWQGRGLKTSESPNGIISIEFAKNIKDANAIVKAVGPKKLKANVYLDFAFIIAYSALLFTICKAIMENFRSPTLKLIGLIFLEVSLVVGALDILENIVMLMTFSGNGSPLSVTITRYAATAKFVLAGIVCLYLFISSVGVIMASIRKGGVHKSFLEEDIL